MVCYNPDAILGVTVVDLTTLLTVAGLFLSVVVGNAAVFGDSLFASIAVPKALETTGFDRPTAERVFAAEVAWYTRLPSILPTPNVTTSSAPSIAMALARPIQLQDLVFAVQTQLRNDVVSVSGAILSDGHDKGLSMLVVVSNPPDAPTSLELQQPDGDARALVRRAARETMITIAPYRVALSDLAGVLTGQKDAIATARETATRGLSQPWDATVQGATEIVLLHNLLAVLAIERRDSAVARRHFELALTTPAASMSSYALVWMNKAFLALTERKAAEAAHAFNKGSDLFSSHLRQTLHGRLQVLEALIAWQHGDEARAEALFVEALTRDTSEIEPHFYLSKMLAARGDALGAAKQMAAAQIAARFDQHYASLAHTILAIDVTTGNLDIRAFVLDELSAMAGHPRPAEHGSPAVATPAK